MKIFLIAAISADGFIAQKSDQLSLDWTSKEDKQFFVSKTKEIGTVVMGRKTFETFGKPLKDRRLIVMSRGTHSEPMDGVEFTSESPSDLVQRLESEGIIELAVCGGASIYSQFLQSGLVNELFLTIEPVLFGTGVPLAPECGLHKMELVDSIKLGEKSILLHFYA